jgi:hypothetical protein
VVELYIHVAVALPGSFFVLDTEKICCMFVIAETQWQSHRCRAADETFSSYPAYVGSRHPYQHVIIPYHSSHVTNSFSTH